MLTEKWVVTYKEKDGKDGIGICNDKKELPNLIEMILSQGGSDIQIKDKSIRIKHKEPLWKAKTLHRNCTCLPCLREERFEFFNEKDSWHYFNGNNLEELFCLLRKVKEHGGKGAKVELEFKHESME